MSFMITTSIKVQREENVLVHDTPTSGKCRNRISRKSIRDYLQVRRDIICRGILFRGISSPFIIHISDQ
jgi:hypothetical protein